MEPIARLGSSLDLPLSLSPLTVPDLPFPTAARVARDCGFRGIGVRPQAVADLGVDGVRAVLDAAEVSPTSICALTGLIGPDSTPAADRLAAADRCLAYAAGLGVPLVVLIGGPGVGLNREQAWQRAAAGFETLVARAARAGVSVLLEPLHPVLIEASVVTSLTDGLALIGRAPNAGLVLDTWHVWWDPRLGQFLRQCGARVGIVHLSDWAPPPTVGLDRVLPGAGVIDLPAMCADILDAGFRGWWEVEILSESLRSGDQAALARAAHDAAAEVLRQALASHPSTG